MMTQKRKSLIFSLALAFGMITIIQVNAQKVELTPFIGYETGAKIYTGYDYLRIGDGMVYGGSLNVNLGGGRYSELSYSHMASTLSYDGYIDKICDLAVDYYSIGALQEVMPGAKATPYGMFTLGLVNYRPTSGGYESENKMHVSLAGGIKIRASERIGIRLQARLLMPIWYGGAYWTVGPGGGGFSVGGGIHGVQGDFTGALFFVL